MYVFIFEKENRRITKTRCIMDRDWLMNVIISLGGSANYVNYWKYSKQIYVFDTKLERLLINH
jgi:hypothetical protein